MRAAQVCLWVASLLAPTWVAAQAKPPKPGVAASAKAVALPEVNEQVCGPLRNSYGPYDYRTQRDRLEIVERFHFDAATEALVRGMTTTKIGGDIGYTLRAFPNHHRALISMVRLADKRGNPFHQDATIPTECWLERAVRFRADDTVVRLIYAQFLNRWGARDRAVQHLQAAEGYAADNPLSQHNIGMVYLDLGLNDQALQQAHRALALGMTQSKLEDRLRSAGLWRDPTSP